MVKILDRICVVFSVVSALLLLFITFSIGYSIFARFVKISSPVWIVQFNEYSLLWMTFLGTAWVLSADKHVSINLVVERLGRGAGKVLGLVNCVLGMGLCGVLGWYGFFTTRETFVRKVIDVQAIDIPKAWILVIIPVGFLLTFFKFMHKFCILLKEPTGREGP
jgi:TRAP-type C4-dicarboxylate transport system permease small subunit